jgi:hypothetical protein
MVYGWIRRREPCQEFVSQLVPCDGISTPMFSGMEIRKEQTFYFMGFCY